MDPKQTETQQTEDPQISDEELFSLAPAVLINHRTRRYHGEDRALSVDELTEADRVILRDIYALLLRLFAVLRGGGEERDRAARTLIGQMDTGKLFVMVRTLGKESYRTAPSPLMAKTLHDVRGGGLSSLLGHLDLHLALPLAALPCDTLYFLTRDHLKIMRNALLGLDDVQRNADLEVNLHGTDLLVEKWDQARIPVDGREVRIAVNCLQDVAIAECCVEFGALDRILYNLMNNASRHTEGDIIRLVLFPTPDRQGENLRLVLINQMSAADRSYLREKDLRTLFRAGVSTTGSGYGLTVAAEFVSSAFGLTTPEAAVEGGYLGARLLHEQFVIWFHWPIIGEV